MLCICGKDRSLCEGFHCAGGVLNMQGGKSWYGLSVYSEMEIDSSVLQGLSYH